MARYDLPPIQSMYRDPQSVAINTELRSRFVGAFTADDQLAAAVDAMESTDFGGDEEAKKRLTDEYNAILDKRSSEGDYENMGMAVSRSARSFVKDYMPLQKNKKAYDEWKAKVDASHESYNTGKGGLNNDEYLKMLERGKHGYTGLEYSEEGTLNEDSYFSGQEFGRSVDEIAELDQALKGIEPDSYENLGVETPVADLETDANGDLVIKNNINSKTGNEPIKYWVTDKNGTIEYIKDEWVVKLAEEVLNKPEIEAGMKQRTELDTFKLNDISEDGVRTNAQVMVDEEQAKLENTIAQLTNKSHLNDEEEAVLTAAKEDLRSLIQDRQEPGGDMKVIQDKMYQKDRDAAIEWATGKFAYTRKRGGRDIIIDAAHLKGKVKTADVVKITGTTVEHRARLVKNPATNDVKGNDHKGSIANKIAQLQEYRENELEIFNNELKESGGTGTYSIEEILKGFTVDEDGRLIDPNGTKLTADESTLNSIQGMLKTNMENEQMTAQLLYESKQNVNYNDRIVKAVENVTAAEIKRGWQVSLLQGYDFEEDYNKAFSENKVTDMVDFYNKLSDRTSPVYKEVMNKYGYNETSPGSGVFYTTAPNGRRIVDVTHLIEPGSRPTHQEMLNLIPESQRTYVDQEGNKQIYRVQTLGAPVHYLLREINNEASSDKETVDAELQEVLDSKDTHKYAYSSQRWPGKDAEESTLHQKMITDKIKEMGVVNTFEIEMPDGSRVDAKNGMASLGMKSYEIKSVDWVPDPVTGEIMYAIAVEGPDVESGVQKREIIFYNAEQVTFVDNDDTDFISDVQNNTAFQIEHKAHKAQYAYGLESTRVELLQAYTKDDGSGNQIFDASKKPRRVTFEYDFANNKMEVFVWDGTKWYARNKFEIGSPEYYKTVKDEYLKIAN